MRKVLFLIVLLAAVSTAAGADPDANHSTAPGGAAQGIDNDVKSYADRKGETESVNDVVWMEKENDAIGKDAVKAYMKEHKLGEYSSTPPPRATPDNDVLPMAKGVPVFSLKDELKIGGAVAVDIVAHNGGILRDETITHRVAIIGKSLGSYCSRPELNFRFAVLNSAQINAYSTPGGYVFITKGLYDLLPDDEQLAAVLAHEISHVTKKHALRVISRSMFVIGLFDASGSIANVGGFDGAASVITAALLAKGFVPNAEFDADQEGRNLAARVGYNHDALLDFLQKLYKQKGDKDAFPTHPPVSQRIQRLEK